MARNIGKLSAFILANTLFVGGLMMAGYQAFVASPTQAAVEAAHVPVAVAPVPVQPVAPETTEAEAPATTTEDAPQSGYIIKRILDTGGPLRFGEYHWDVEGVPDGNVVITVDLKAQVLSIFRDGYEIGTAAILFGSDEKPTPTGIFPITQKDADHVSNIYGSPMPYMLRMTNDGISVHGSDVEWGYVTHGCIGIPTEFAKKIFGIVKLGDKVIVTDGEVLDQGKSITAA